MSKTFLRLLAVVAMIATVTFGWSSLPASAAPAPDANSVLILDETVTGGMGSLEATTAVALGYTVVVVDDATWGAMSTADFASYRAIILGDPTCVLGTGPIDAAESNAATWGPAITGNVVIIGTDPTFHQGIGGAQLTESGIAFAADEAGETGAYITLSCYYAAVGVETPVPLLDAFSVGGFSVIGHNAEEAHIMAVHPALAGLTNADLDFWFNSTHDAFLSWPADFQVLALVADVLSGEPVCGVDIEGNDVCGTPYILARGEDLKPPSSTEVSKSWSHTNVCFERDNDGDGSFGEDPAEVAVDNDGDGRVDEDLRDGVDNDVDGLVDEDPSEQIDNDEDGALNEDGSDCADGSHLGDVLVDGQAKAVVSKSGVVKNYNPGQVYAVTRIDLAADSTFNFVEDWSDCLSLLSSNPVGGGGRLVVVRDNGGSLEQILDANEIVAAGGTVDADGASFVLDLDAGTYYVLAKFAPVTGWDIDDTPLPIGCDNTSTVQLDDDGDGEFNEDPEDGADNDGDGEIDEDTDETDVSDTATFSVVAKA